MKKRGYFFTLDAFLAISILIIGLLALFSFRSQNKETTQSTFIANDLIALVSTTEIYEFNNVYLDSLKYDGTIRNEYYTLLEEIGELYFLNKTNIARKIIINITSTAIPYQYGMSIIIDNATIFNTTEDYFDSDILISTKRIIFGQVNKTIFWGPFKAEVRIWR